MAPWTHFFCKPLDTFWHSGHILALWTHFGTLDTFWHSGHIFLETSSPTYFLAGFLIVLGPLEISAEKSGAKGFQKNVSRVPKCVQSAKMCPEVCRKNVSRVPPYTTDNVSKGNCKFNENPKHLNVAGLSYQFLFYLN